MLHLYGRICANDGHSSEGHSSDACLQDNLRWNAGNRESGRDDEGSVHSSRHSSRAGSRHGGSAYDGGSRHGGSSFGGSRHSGTAYVVADASAHGGSHHGGSHHGGDRSAHGGSRLANGSKHGGSEFFNGGSRAGGSDGGGSLSSIRSPGYELPGQGGPLQDNAGVSPQRTMSCCLFCVPVLQRQRQQAQRQRWLTAPWLTAPCRRPVGPGDLLGGDAGGPRATACRVQGLPLQVRGRPLMIGVGLPTAQNALATQQQSCLLLAAALRHQDVSAPDVSSECCVLMNSRSVP